MAYTEAEARRLVVEAGKKLLELGLVTREDLVQRIQLYPEAYPETAWEAVPDSGNVIGGADMLTSVMVMG